MTLSLSENQKKVLYAFLHPQAQGKLTSEEMRKSSPHWCQAAKSLCRMGLIRWSKTCNGYIITPEGGSVLIDLFAEGVK